MAGTLSIEELSQSLETKLSALRAFSEAVEPDEAKVVDVYSKAGVKVQLLLSREGFAMQVESGHVAGLSFDDKNFEF